MRYISLFLILLISMTLSSCMIDGTPPSHGNLNLSDVNTRGFSTEIIEHDCSSGAISINPLEAYTHVITTACDKTDTCVATVRPPSANPNAIVNIKNMVRDCMVNVNIEERATIDADETKLLRTHESIQIQSAANFNQYLLLAQVKN